MKLSVEVQVPKRLLVSTALLVELIGAERVHQLVATGAAVAGQKAYRKKRHGAQPAADPAPLTEQQERELDALNADMERGLSVG